MTVLYANPSNESFVGIRKAARIASRSTGTVQRLAIAGKIRVLVEPGFLPRFAVTDLEWLAEQPRQ